LYTSTNGKHKFRPVTFLRNGLLLEKAKGPVVVAQRKNAIDTPFISKMEEVVTTACNPARALKRFISYNKDRVQHITQNGNYTLFGSPETGGLGLTEPSESNTYYTPFQNKFSGFLYKKNRGQIDDRVMDTRDITFSGMITSINDLSSVGAKPIQSTCRVVLRDKLEPMRENEEILPIANKPFINNCQVVANGSPELTWRTRRPKTRILKEFRELKFPSKRKSPKIWDLVVRKMKNLVISKPDDITGPDEHMEWGSTFDQDDYLDELRYSRQW